MYLLYNLLLYLWLNYRIGKVNFKKVEFLAVKVITLFNMLLSMHNFIVKVDSAIVLYTFTLLYVKIE